MFLSVMRYLVGKACQHPVDSDINTLYYIYVKRKQIFHFAPSLEVLQDSDGKTNESADNSNSALFILSSACSI